MYTQFFGLKQAPFSIAPDPRYLFMSERHREALAHLLYGINSGGGFVLLTGEIGAGKTTVCRCFLEQIPENCNVAYIFNPKLTVNELLKSVCDEFHIKLNDESMRAATVKDYVDALNKYLLSNHAEGQNNVLIIDEAQNLSSDVLEQLRLLTNLETNERKLLQIILIGQPELRTMLARPELEQLAQRVMARYHLDSLSAQETARYILHRLSIAGLTAARPFRRRLMRQIHQLTQGVPRRINLLCDRALLGAYAESKHEVDRDIIRKAASEVFGNDRVSAQAKAQLWRYMVLGLVAGVTVAGAAGWAVNDSLRTKIVTEKSALTAVADGSIKAASIALKSESAKSGEPIQPSPVVAAAANAPNQPVTGNGSDSAQAAIQTIAPATTSILSGVSGTSLPDENSTYRQLAQLWNVSLQEGAPCLAAQKMHLHCYKSSNGLAEIRQLDRPALLTLRDDTNKTYYALLIGLTNTNATLRIGSVTQNVTLLALARRWSGDFATFWRAPQAYSVSVGSGDKGAEVDWLAVQLAKLNGVKEPLANQPFDQAMVKQVREFQFANGLAADGVAGPKTFMLLNNAAGISEPRLQNSLAVVNALPGK